MPAEKDEWNKYRLYREDQAKDFLLLKLLQHFHFELKDMKEMSREETTEDVLLAQLASLRREIEERQKEYHFLKSMHVFFFQTAALQDVLKKQTVGPFLLLSQTIQHAEYDKVGEYITDLHKTAERLKIQVEERELVFYHDREFKPKNSVIEVALVCSRGRKVALPEGIVFRKFPRTKVLSYDYHGPYEYFILLYQKLFGVLDKEKIQLTGPAFDIYVKSASKSRSVYDIFTKLCFPVE
jgi:effector-binding domain-containing protein